MWIKTCNDNYKVLNKNIRYILNSNLNNEVNSKQEYEPSLFRLKSCSGRVCFTRLSDDFLRLARLCQIIIIVIKLSFHEIQHNEDKLAEAVAQNKCELKKKINFQKLIIWKGSFSISKLRYLEKFWTDFEFKASFKIIEPWAFIWGPIRRPIKKIGNGEFIWPKIFFQLFSKSRKPETLIFWGSDSTELGKR